MQDTFNLLASGIRQLGRVLAQQEQKKPEDFFAENSLDRYTKDSVKGSVDLDWSEEDAKNTLLTQIVADAKRLLAQATSSQPCVREADSLLEALLLQDVEVKATDYGEQATIKEGTAPGRMPSATDPDVRHGRKSASKRFNGHKADVTDCLSRAASGSAGLPEDPRRQGASSGAGGSGTPVGAPGSVRDRSGALPEPVEDTLAVDGGLFACQLPVDLESGSGAREYFGC